MSSYPLGQSEADTITSRTGKKLSQITLDEVKKEMSQPMTLRFPLKH
ncbi:MAG: diol dehydratase small subunit [Blautia sp.]